MNPAKAFYDQGSDEKEDIQDRMTKPTHSQKNSKARENKKRKGLLKGMDLKALERATKDKSGIYFVSYENKSKNCLVKVGMSNDLWKRLDSYLLYYPTGYWVFGLYTCRKNQVHQLEREIHSYLISKAYLTEHDDSHSHGQEWFLFPNRKTLSTVMFQSSWSIKHTEINTESFRFYNTEKQRPYRIASLGKEQKKRIERDIDSPPLTDKKKSLPVVAKNFRPKQTLDF